MKNIKFINDPPLMVICIFNLSKLINILFFSVLTFWWLPSLPLMYWDR